MTPHLERLHNVRQIPRQPIRAANSQLFTATAEGDMTTTLPEAFGGTTVTIH
ncbi:hypothetical protein BDN72DRAFT_804695, partial [Pluteus cervinus]